MTLLNNVFDKLMDGEKIRLTSEELDTVILDLHKESHLQGHNSTWSYLKSDACPYGSVVRDVIAPRLRRAGKTNVPDMTWTTFVEK